MVIIDKNGEPSFRNWRFVIPRNHRKSVPGINYAAVFIDEVFGIVNERAKAIRLVVMAKSALRHNLRDEIYKMNLPVCLIWGKDDNITPAFVGEEFRKLLPNAELHIIDQCGHVPMMEHPVEFNRLMLEFLTRNP